MTSCSAPSTEDLTGCLAPASVLLPAHCSQPLGSHLTALPSGASGAAQPGSRGATPTEVAALPSPWQEGTGSPGVAPCGALAGEQDSRCSKHGAACASTGCAAQRRLPGANRTQICNDFVFLLSQPCWVRLGSAGRWCLGTWPGQGHGALPPACCPLCQPPPAHF